MRVALVAGSLWLSGCATPPLPTGYPLIRMPDPLRVDPCTAADAAYGVGQIFSPELGEEMRAAAKASALRVIRPGDVVTTEYQTGRLNIELDAKNAVRGVSCG
jgi:hypothetical protein